MVGVLVVDTMELGVFAVVRVSVEALIIAFVVGFIVVMMVVALGDS